MIWLNVNLAIWVASMLDIVREKKRSVISFTISSSNTIPRLPTIKSTCAVYFAREAAVAGLSRVITDSILSMAVCSSSMDAAYEIRMHPPLPKASPGTSATCNVTMTLRIWCICLRETNRMTFDVLDNKEGLLWMVTFAFSRKKRHNVSASEMVPNPST